MNTYKMQLIGNYTVISFTVQHVEYLDLSEDLDGDTEYELLQQCLNQFQQDTGIEFLPILTMPYELEYLY